MTFDYVIKDLERLIGITLKSIKPGAEIVIQQVNKDQNRIVLLTSKGKLQTRPISELKTIWEKICQCPAVHVDEILHGSGTSRNQPETLLANLPYIEWFKYNRKKHIAFIGSKTHPLGSLKQMDETKAEAVRDKLRNGNIPVPGGTVLVVTKDIYNATKTFENLTGVSVKPIQNGIYKANNVGNTVIFTTSTSAVPSLDEGTYLIINRVAETQTAYQVEINGIKYSVERGHGLNVLVLYDDSRNANSMGE